MPVLVHYSSQPNRKFVRTIASSSDTSQNASPDEHNCSSPLIAPYGREYRFADLRR
jgi:hypothetical protein